MAGKSGVSLNWGGFDKAIGNAVKKMADKKLLMATIGETLVSSTLKRFTREESPEGVAWEKSERAMSQGGQTLSDTGLLKRSIEYAATPTKVMVGSNKEYARIHQKGGIIKPKNGKALKFKGRDGKNVFVKQVKIPARPYLGISEEDKKEVRETINDFLIGAFK